MPSLRNLPIELLDEVIFHLETPQDLLHLALTCKAFYNFIIPTYRLHFPSISCDWLNTPLKFWEKLSESPRLCSIIRHLELSDDEFLSGREACDIQSFRINRWTLYFKTFKFIDPTWHLELTSPRYRIDFHALLQYLNKIRGLQSITVYQECLLAEECDGLLAFVSSHLPDRLHALVIHTRVSDFEPFVPKCLSNCSFERMETLHFDFRDCTAILFQKITVMMDSLISTCSTLVDFTLYLTCHHQDDHGCFVYYNLMKHASWGSLKKLRLGGDIQLFDPQENSADVYISFLDRHLQLECLYLDLCSGLYEPFRAELPPHVLPNLRALSTTSPIHPGILPRLHHISNLDVFDPETYPLARSLRSCIFNMYGWADNSKGIVEAFPYLEHLCVVVEECLDCVYYNRKCDCASSDAPYDLLKKMFNLTHLGFSGKDIDMKAIDKLLQDLLKHLPKLSYLYDNIDKRHMPTKSRIFTDRKGNLQKKFSREPISSYWYDDFFNRMVDECLIEEIDM